AVEALVSADKVIVCSKMRVIERSYEIRRQASRNLGCRRRLHGRQALLEDRPRLADETPHQLVDREDRVDQAGILAKEKGHVIGVAGGPGVGDLLGDLATAAAQLGFAAAPFRDEGVSPGTRIGTGPGRAARQI